MRGKERQRKAKKGKEREAIEKVAHPHWCRRKKSTDKNQSLPQQNSHTYLVGYRVHSGAIFLKIADGVVAQHVQVSSTPAEIGTKKKKNQGAN